VFLMNVNSEAGYCGTAETAAKGQETKVIFCEFGEMTYGDLETVIGEDEGGVGSS